MLLSEADAAGVVAAWRAIAIAAPIADRFDDRPKLYAVREHRALNVPGDLAQQCDQVGVEAVERGPERRGCAERAAPRRSRLHARPVQRRRLLIWKPLDDDGAC